MTRKWLGLLISPLLFNTAITQAAGKPTVDQFVKVNSWHCEKTVANPQALVTALNQDKRLTLDKDTELFALGESGNRLGLLVHPQGCTTFSYLDSDNQLPLDQIVAALQKRGYQKQSQDVTTATGVMMSQTKFTKAGLNAILIYPLDKKADQQVSLTTANYGNMNTTTPVANNEAVDMHRQNAGTAGQDGWFTARSTKGGFEVKVPVKFNDFTVKSKESKEVKSVEMIVANSAEGIKFLASRTFYEKAATADTYFQNFVSGKALPGAPRRSLKFKNYDAVLIEDANQQQATSQLVIKVQDTLMVLAVEWPVAQSPAAKKLGDQFFNSFKLSN